MPTYGYRCTACSHEFERFQKITDPAVTECESCGGAVKKILYPVGIQFKGSGFYVNDSKGSGGSAARASESGSSAAKSEGSAGSESGSSTSSSTSSETSKPAAAPSSSGSAASS